jgi:Cytochrome C'
VKSALFKTSILLLPCMLACEQPKQQLSSPAPSPYRPVATIQEIMQAVIDPNIDFVWNSVSSVSTVQGTEEKSPQSDQDWLDIKQHALVVAEAANLLVVEGRTVAHNSANTSSGGAELSAQAIQQLIDTNRGAFVQRAQELQQAVNQVLAAIEHKNVEELENGGGLVEHACEQCHTQFWYPNDNRPK